jgi:aspartate kinase
MNIIVQKYGGSSVADADRIKNVANRVSKKISSGYKAIIVVSAMGKTTDGLIDLAKQISFQPDPRELDMLLSTGEQVSASLLSMALLEAGFRSKSFNAFQAGIKTTGNFNEAKIINFENDKILSIMEDLDALVVTGFQGITEEGEITTLGRGGSDTSAVALAAALKADCEIYSDVAGVFTVDPRLHPKAKKLKYIAYDEMLEMASLGAKVLHSRSVEVAKKFNIKLYCGSSFSDEEGTYVVNEDIIIEQPLVTGLSLTENETQVYIKNLPSDPTLMRKMFHKVAEAGLNVDMISMIDTGTALQVSFTIVESKRHLLDEQLNKIFRDLEGLEIEYHPEYIKLSIVGIGMRSGIGVASNFFHAMEGIPVKMVTTSEIKISCLIEEKFKQKAVDAIIKEFNL